jgi:DNA-directed RNA polymerase sigma subunit (sigma70/sigma32)
MPCDFYWFPCELRAVGLNAATVRQIQVEALRRLRTIMENNGLGSDSLFT